MTDLVSFLRTYGEDPADTRRRALDRLHRTERFFGRFDSPAFCARRRAIARAHRALVTGGAGALEAARRQLIGREIA